MVDIAQGALVLIFQEHQHDAFHWKIVKKSALTNNYYVIVFIRIEEFRDQVSFVSDISTPSERTNFNT